MGIIFYLPEIIEENKGIQIMIQALSRKTRITVFKDIEEFFFTLQRPAKSPFIATVIPGTKHELMEIAKMKRILFGIPTMLILPDREEKTIALGYSFYPRHLTYMDCPMTEILAVLEKMLDRYLRDKEINGELQRIWN